MIGYSEADRHPLRWASGHLKPQGGLVSSVLQVCCGVNGIFIRLCKGWADMLGVDQLYETFPCTNRTDSERKF